MKKNKRKSLKVLDDAKDLFENAEYEKALDLCEDALVHSVKNEEAWRLKAIALGKLERNDEAVFAAEKRMSIFPESEQAIYDYCLELVRGDMGAELKKFFEKADAGERGAKMLKLFEGLLLLKQKKEEEAKKILEESISDPGMFLAVIGEAQDAAAELFPKDGALKEFVIAKVGDARKKELEMLKTVYGIDEAGEDFAKLATDKNLGSMERMEFETKLYEILSNAHAQSHSHEHADEPTKEDMDAVFKDLDEKPDEYREEYSKFLAERTKPGWRYKEKELFAEFVYITAKRKKAEAEAIKGAVEKAGGHVHDENCKHEHGEEGHVHDENCKHEHSEKKQDGKEHAHTHEHAEHKH